MNELHKFLSFAAIAGIIAANKMANEFSSKCSAMFYESMSMITSKSEILLFAREKNSKFRVEGTP